MRLIKIKNYWSLIHNNSIKNFSSKIMAYNHLKGMTDYITLVIKLYYSRKDEKRPYVVLFKGKSKRFVSISEARGWIKIFVEKEKLRGNQVLIEENIKHDPFKSIKKDGQKIIVNINYATGTLSFQQENLLSILPKYGLKIERKDGKNKVGIRITGALGNNEKNHSLVNNIGKVFGIKINTIGES